MVVAKSARVVRIAGIKPDKIALTSATTTLTSRTRRSSSNVSTIGRSVGIRIRRNNTTPAYPTPSPSTAPIVAMSRLSTRSCWTIRERPAPRASRSAISRALTERGSRAGPRRCHTRQSGQQQKSGQASRAEWPGVPHPQSCLATPSTPPVADPDWCLGTHVRDLCQAPSAQSVPPRA